MNLARALALLWLYLTGDTTAIKDVTVVVSPEKTIEKGTILIRDGLIVAVGERVEIPPGAEIIDGSGLIAYAGFIDAHCTVGLGDTKRTPEQQKQAEGRRPEFTKEAPPRMAEANRKGLRPELRAVEIVNVSEADAKSWTSQGFAAANVAVKEEYFSGTGVLVALSGAPRRQVVIVPDTFLHASFRSYGDGYPTTIFGALAHLRQILHDARAYRAAHEEYRRDPVGRVRPPVDAALEALQPVLDGRTAVCFEANTETEILRAIAFAREMNLKIVISGGREAYKVVDELKGVPVLLSLDLPPEPRSLPKERAREFVEKPPKLVAEERRLWEERVQCAVKLHEAGVPFAFTTFGTRPKEAMENLGKIRLPREVKLRALTVTPARIFGVEKQLGTIEVGKIANLAVFTRPLGEKGSKIRMTFVDGRKFESEPPKKPEVDLTGAWTGRVDGPQGSLELTLELKQEGNDLSGMVKSKMGEAAITSGTVSGTSVEIGLTVPDVGEVTVTAEYRDGRLSGKIKGPQGYEADFSAARPR